MNDYLTFAEYQTFTTALNEVTQERFPKLLLAASDRLNTLTNNFYVFNEMANDTPFRITSFKKAITQLIDYYNYTGGTHSYQTNNASSVQIGRTNLTNSSSSQSGTNSSIQTLGIPNEVLDILRSAGFLYRGVGVLCR